MVNMQSQNSLTDKVQIEVYGEDLDGRQFIERAETLRVTRDGATITMANKLAPESELVIRNLATSQEAVARVMELIHDAPFVHVYAVALIDSTAGLWQVEFPTGSPKKSVAMECSRCQGVDAITLREIELEIFESKRALTRHCERCNAATLWKPTDRKVAEKSGPEKTADHHPRQFHNMWEQVPRRPQERRREKRIPMNVPACIRHSRGDEIVECEDVSRGGFRFKSHKPYSEGAWIEAAVPYGSSSVSPFVAARIAYRQDLSDGTFRHGVAYVKSAEESDSF
jgi:hypothetical protein